MNAVEFQGVGKRYRIGARGDSYLTLRETLSSLRPGRRRGPAAEEFWALRDLDLTIGAGEVLGVIGRNGAGKSTLLKILARITEPTTGTSRTRGRVGALLEVGTGFHPELTGRENIFLNGSVLGMRQRDIARRFDEIVDFAGVERFLDTPLKRYSSGMYLRLAFAVAAHVEPPIVAVDEILAVGDLEFQKRCLGKMSELHAEGRTVIFVSHDLGAITHLCRRTVWIDGGAIKADGPSATVVEQYVRDGGHRAAEATFAPVPGDLVSLLSVAVTDDAGAPDPAPRRHRPLHLRLRWQTHERTPGLDVAVALLTTRGTRVVWDTLSDHTGGTTGALDEPGLYEARVEVPPVLPAGDYVVEVWMGTELENLFYREALEFRLEPHPHDRSEWIERDRLVQPPVEWRVMPPEGPS